MASINDILDALAQQLEANLTPPAGITLHIEGHWFPIAETPAIDMRVTSPSGLEDALTGYGATYGAIPVVIRVRCGMAASIEGQELLYDLIDAEGDLSIIAALDLDPTLGGVVDSLAWGDGFPWSGVEPYVDLNGDGQLAGSELTLVIVRKQT